MSEVQIIVFLLSLEGLLFVGIGYAMPNMRMSRLVGIRVGPTMADERVWRDTHVRAGPRFRRVGWLILGSGVLLTAVPTPDWLTLGAFTVIAVGSLAWFTVDSYRYAAARLRHYHAIDEAVGSRE
ncbi:MAG: SdpI family protein [Dehalococcoidia bacterium]